MKSSQGIVRVVFRYDDCSARSSLELESKLIQIFVAHGIQATFGVIPFVCSGDMHDASYQKKLPLSREKIEILKKGAQSGHIEVALHGCYHQYCKKGWPYEFAGLPESEQERRIIEGRKELEEKLEVSIATFIPPWNAYDDQTLRILENTSFKCLSASLRGPFPATSRKQFLPASCWFNGLKDVVPAACKIRRLNPIIVVMLHDFTFFESGSKDAHLSLEEFNTMLERLKGIPYVEICSLGHVVTKKALLSGFQLDLPRRWRAFTRYFPWRIRYLIEDQILLLGTKGTGKFEYFYGQNYVTFKRVSHDFARAMERKICQYFFSKN